MTHLLTTIISLLEDAFFTWAVNNSPTLLTIAILMWLPWWIRGQISSIDSKFRSIDSRFSAIDSRFSAIDDRFTKLESDVRRFEKKLKSFGKRLTRVERKLDMLIVHLTSTKKIDSDVPLH